MAAKLHSGPSLRVAFCPTLLETPPHSHLAPFPLCNSPIATTGTYRAVPRVEWTVLLSKEFGHPDWALLYPVNPAKGVFNELDQTTIYSELLNKGQLLSPRMACKLFHDGLYICKKGEESPKFVQDRIPELCHKMYKKKQWRKQFFESMRRVCCRLAIGLGFRPNCLAEDAFIHAILGMGYELGWKRIEEHLAGLPFYEKDRDFSRVAKFGANEDVGNLLNGSTAAAAASGKKDKAAIDVSKIDVKTGWFRCYDVSSAHTLDHIVRLDDEETDDWSATTGSSVDSHGMSGRQRSDSVRSDISTESASLESASLDSADRPRAGSGAGLPGSPSNRKSRGMSNLEQLDENAVHHSKSESTADLAGMANVSIKQ